MNVFFYQGFIAIAVTSLVAPAVLAQVPTAEITTIQLQPTKDRLELQFKLKGNVQPSVSTTARDNTLVIEFANTELRLPNASLFQQDNPTVDFASVVVIQAKPNSVWVVVNGKTSLPKAETLQLDPTTLAVSLSPSSSSQSVPVQQPTVTQPSPLVPIPSQESSQRPNTLPISSSTSPPVSGVNSPSQLASPGLTNTSTSEVLPIRAPGGNLIYSDIYLDDAKTQLMRTYQLNQVKVTSDSIVTQNLTSLAETGGTVGGTGSSSTLNSGSGFSNSSGFDVRATAATAQTSIKRTTATVENVRYQGAKEFLELFGANNGGQPKVPLPSNLVAAQPPGAQFSGSGFSQPQSFSPNIPSQAVAPSSRILNGLEVIAEPRTNTLTLIGSRRLVEIATIKLQEMDVATKQVAINIKIIDVDLTKGMNSNTDLQYRATNTLGFGFNSSGFFTNAGRNAAGVGVATPLAQNFLANLVAAIQNQSARILTNPTLVVQEASSAQVNLTQEIFSGFETIEDTRFLNNANNVPLRRRPIIRPAGVIVNVTVDRIDKNGFVTLNISPEISAPSGAVFSDQGSEARLLLQRRLETGRVRLRDGQSLLLTGIIQEQERVNINKVPVLGDIPLLGILFRRREKTSERREVIVVVTPQILNDDLIPPLGVHYQPSSEVNKLLNR